MQLNIQTKLYLESNKCFYSNECGNHKLYNIKNLHEPVLMMKKCPGYIVHHKHLAVTFWDIADKLDFLDAKHVHGIFFICGINCEFI